MPGRADREAAGGKVSTQAAEQGSSVVSHTSIIYTALRTHEFNILTPARVAISHNV